MTASIICIGGSAGSISIVQEILAKLPPVISLPIVIVIHRPSHSTPIMSRMLLPHGRLAIIEPCDKDPINAGSIYLAPAGYHLLVDRSGFCLSMDEPVRHARPSIDLLFQSAATLFAQETMGIVLSGANDDGAHGSGFIQSRGGTVIVQDPNTAEVASMPKNTLAIATNAEVLSPSEISLRINTILQLRIQI